METKSTGGSQQEQPADAPPPPAAAADCAACRVTGTGVCLAAAASLAWRAGERRTGAGHRATLVGGAAVFAALAAARWLAD